MSIADDVRDCLIWAVHDRKNLDLTREDLNTRKPSTIGVIDGAAWHTILKIAASCMRSKGHSVSKPELERATELHGEFLAQSQVYILELGTAVATEPRRRGLQPALVAGGIAVAIVTVAIALRDLPSRTAR